MRFKNSLSAAVLGAALAAPLAFIATSQNVQAQQQAAPEPTKQIPLKAEQIDAFLAAQADMTAATANLPEQTGDKPDPKVLAQLDTIAKKYKFAGYQDYDDVAANIGLVIAGIDPETKKFVGADVVIKKQIAEVQADKKLSAKDKKEQLDDLKEQLKSVEAVKIPANIELVTKYYDKLSAATGEGQN
jgi:hypothetical protein